MATKNEDRPTREQELRDELELAWGIIANAGGGDWKTQTEVWQDAAKRWRDRYHVILDLPPSDAATEAAREMQARVLKACDDVADDYRSVHGVEDARIVAHVIADTKLRIQALPLSTPVPK